MVLLKLHEYENEAIKYLENQSYCYWDVDFLKREILL